MKLFGLIRIIDENLYRAYLSKVRDTLKPYAGKVIDRGGRGACLWDELEIGRFETYVILEFPNRESAIAWAGSDAYRTILSIRQAAMQLTLFELT